MNSKTYTVIGVMSGTSKDGIDLAHIRFTLRQGEWHYTFLNCATLPYSPQWKKRLEEADQLAQGEVHQLDSRYTEYLASTINTFIDDCGITILDAICSHGHTVFHQPEKKYTLQIGNLPKIANYTHQKVVCDFRTADVSMGGQGAPLVPMGDQLLFSKYEACLNLGGFANISRAEKGTRKAYDICAANTVLNHYAMRLGQAYDNKGKIAREEKSHPPLLKKLNELPFYRLSPPKSLGIEWVKGEVFPLIDHFHLSPNRILATYTQHIAQQLAHAAPSQSSAKILITGGGAYNDFLIESIRKQTSCQVVIPDEELINYKEALIFGLLGVLRLRNENNILGEVTGAPKDHSAGVIFEPSF